MSTHRVTMLLQQGRAGWSESFYTDAPTPELALAPIQAAGPLRRRLLGTTGAIIGYRAQAVVANGLTRILTVDEPAISPTLQDPPYNSLLVTMRTGTGLKRQYYLRGIPDAQIGAAIFAPTSTFNTNLVAYFAYLAASVFSIRTLARSNLPKAIVSVSGVGLVTFFEAHGLNVPHIVQFLNVKDTTGRAVQGQFKVLPAPGATTLSLQGWEPDRVVAGGALRKVDYEYPLITSVTQDKKIVSRKVGRPFGSPVGRRSARR